jgi:hypothetical protein
MLADAGYVTAFDAETGMFPNQHDSRLRELARLVKPALDGAVFEEDAPSGDEGPYRLVAYFDGKRYRAPARNLGDWYDVEAMLGLLNVMLETRGRDERMASLQTEDQIAWVVGGPRSAIDAAFAKGVLVPGDAGDAEGEGKAFEDEVLESLED